MPNPLELMFHSGSLRRRILLPVALVTSGLLAAFVYGLHASLDRLAEQEFRRDAASLKTYWSNVIERRVETLESALHLLALDRDPGEREDANPDRLWMEEAARRHPELQQLSLLRFYRPTLRSAADQGDAGPTARLLRDAAAGVTAYVLDRTAQGEVALLVAVPLRVRERTVGIALAGDKASAVLKQLDDLFPARHLLLLPTGEPRAFLTAYASDTPLPPPVAALISGGRMDAFIEGVLLRENEASYYAKAVPLTDKAQATMAYLVAVSDVSQPHGVLLRLNHMVTGIGAAMVLVVLALLHRVTSRTEERLARSYHKLSESNRRLEQAHREWIDSIDAIREPIFLHDAQFHVLRANRAYAEKAGKRFRDIIGKPYWEAFPPGAGPLHGKGEVQGPTEVTVRLASGEVYLSRAFPIRDAEGRYLYSVHILEDITEQQHMMQALQREIRARRTVSHSNEALIRATTEEGLLQQICDIITGIGGYRMVWVGFRVEDFHRSIRPVAAAGISVEQVAALKPTWADNPRGQTPAGAAIRTGQTQLEHDPRRSENLALRRRAELTGCNAVLAFPLLNEGHAFGVINICAEDGDAFNDDEVRLLKELAGDLAYGLTSLRSRAERERAERERSAIALMLEQSLDKTVQAMANALEARDPYTAGHQRRVSELAVAIAREMELSAGVIESLRIAGTVHDVGKIYVPAEILSKPGKLSPVEYQLVQSHSRVGYDILKEIDFPWPIAEMVLQHHERMDGSGYPRGLKGEAILPEARILAVADVVEAMGSHRPYRPSLSIDEALAEITTQRGTRFDEAVVDACVRLFREKGYQL